MIDLIKKTVLAGIGATVVTKEKIEAALQDLVKQGKVSTDEAKVLASKLAEDGRKEWETTSQDLGERIRDLLAKADYARKSEVAALAQRIQSLEDKIDALTRVANP
jgi:polyhydroxyalkanoate synthesis regulator phasin